MGVELKDISPVLAAALVGVPLVTAIATDLSVPIKLAAPEPKKSLIEHLTA